MKKHIIYLAILLATAGCQVQDAAPVAPAQKCSGPSCEKTVTSKSAEEVRIEEAIKERESRIAKGSDAGRWSQPLYSEVERPEELEHEIIRSAGFKMRLDPKKGHLTFESPELADTFKIAAPADAPNSVCPKYNFTVIDASTAHVLLKLNCPKYELTDGSIFMSSEFLLYDVRTSSMRRIWMGIASEKGQEFPTAEPTPAIKRTADGYHFEWVGVWPNSIDKALDKIGNRYTWYREKTTGKLELRCTDLDAPKDEAVENSVCGLGYIPLVSSLRK